MLEEIDVEQIQGQTHPDWSHFMPGFFMFDYSGIERPKQKGKHHSVGRKQRELNEVKCFQKELKT